MHAVHKSNKPALLSRREHQNRAHLIRNSPVLGIHLLHVIYFRSANFLSSLIDIRFLKDLWTRVQALAIFKYTTH